MGVPARSIWNGVWTMKKTIALLAVMSCLAGTTTAFARGGYGYYDRGYSGGRHHHHGLGVAVGVVGGLLLGSALVSAATAPPPVVYGSPYVAYPPTVVVQPPPVCIEDRVVSGEWQISQYDGSRIWVSYPYPVTQRIEVPCY